MSERTGLHFQKAWYYAVERYRQSKGRAYDAWKHWQHRAAQRREIWDRLAHGERMSLRLQAILIVVTAAYTFVAYLQWDALKATLAAQQKAIVMVGPTTPDFVRSSIPLIVKNIGLTPSYKYNVRVTEIRYLREGPCPGGHSTVLDGILPAFPKEPIIMGISMAWLTDSERSDILADREVVQIRGGVEYDTGFEYLGASHYSFCWDYIVNMGQWAGCRSDE